MSKEILMECMFCNGTGLRMAGGTSIECRFCDGKGQRDIGPEVASEKAYNEKHSSIAWALRIVTDNLTADKSPGSYYYSWQANIAIAFVDAYQQFPLHPDLINYRDLHEIANKAAKNFLDQLCS